MEVLLGLELDAEVLDLELEEEVLLLETEEVCKTIFSWKQKKKNNQTAGESPLTFVLGGPAGPGAG